MSSDSLSSVDSLNIDQLNPRLSKSASYSDNHFMYLLENRIASFSRFWPRSLAQKPRVLAEAGLYYSGTGDMVICHKCNGGLYQWLPNDIPMVEHMLWYPKCPNSITTATNNQLLLSDEGVDAIDSYVDDDDDSDEDDITLKAIEVTLRKMLDSDSNANFDIDFDQIR